MTTSAGFFRYDLGDHVRVRGYLARAPLLEFLHRGAHVSSVTGEKLTEWQVVTAFNQSVRTLGLTAREFILGPAWADPPFYRLHIEYERDPLESGRDSHHEATKLARQLDTELASINVEYAAKRVSGRLGPIVPNSIPEGTLAARHRLKTTNSWAISEQVKMTVLYTIPGDDADLIPQQVPQLTPS
jgi:hypothetical protein